MAGKHLVRIAMADRRGTRRGRKTLIVLGADGAVRGSFSSFVKAVAFACNDETLQYTGYSVCSTRCDEPDTTVYNHFGPTREWPQTPGGIVDDLAAVGLEACGLLDGTAECERPAGYPLGG